MFKMTCFSKSSRDLGFTGYAAAKARKYGRKQLLRGINKKYISQ